MNRKINNYQLAGPKGVSLVFIFLGLDINGMSRPSIQKQKIIFS